MDIHAWGFSGGASGQEPTCQCRRHKRPGFSCLPGRFPEGGHDNTLWYSCLENLMDGAAWTATVHGVARNWTQLSDLSCTQAHMHPYSNLMKASSKNRERKWLKTL